MDPTALATFLCVARRGSVTAAALELHTVQSNVTARIRQLESELEVELFARHSRGMILTAAGHRLMSYAMRLKALEVETRTAVRDDGVVRGGLRIGSMETAAAVRLPDVLGRFHRTYPEVQLDVRTGPTAELLEHVLAQRLDGALVAGPINHPDITSTAVFPEELVVVSARGSGSIGQRLAQGGLTAIVFRQGCSYRQRLETEFSARGWLPYRRIEFGTVEGILGCVSANIGVTVLPRSVIEQSRSRNLLRIEAFAPDPLWVHTLFVSRKGAYVSSTLRAFEEALDMATKPRAVSANVRRSEARARSEIRRVKPRGHSRAAPVTGSAPLLRP